MALLAETVVEEWLMRNGYFTIRGLKLGVHEIDILAIKNDEGHWKCLHVEVQASHNPVGYVSGNSNAKTRSMPELNNTVSEWIDKKYHLPKKQQVRERLGGTAKWGFMFVHGVVRHLEELEMIRKKGIETKPIAHVIKELLDGKYGYTTASAGDLVELIRIPHLTIANLQSEVIASLDRE